MCIYVLFLFISISNKYTYSKCSTYLKFSSILLCFIISLLLDSIGYNHKDVLLLQLARFFTLVADYFLILSTNYILGVLFFSVVQLLYIKRHSLMKKNKFKQLEFNFTDSFEPKSMKRQNKDHNKYSRFCPMCNSDLTNSGITELCINCGYRFCSGCGD